MSLKDELKTAFLAAQFEKNDYTVEYDSETGAYDESFWEFWKIAGGQFGNSDKADFIGMLLDAYRDGKLVVKE